MIKDSRKLKYITESDSTIEEAWTKIEVNMHRSVIIVDNGKVVGTLSDGDLRKAMLARRLLAITGVGLGILAAIGAQAETAYYVDGTNL